MSEVQTCEVKQIQHQEHSQVFKHTSLLSQIVSLFLRFPGIRKGEMRRVKPSTSGHQDMPRWGKATPKQSRSKARAQTPPFSAAEGSVCWDTNQAEVLLQSIEINSGSTFTRSVIAHTSPHKSRDKLECLALQRLVQGHPGVPRVSSITSVLWDTSEPNSGLEFEVHRAFNNPTKHFVSTENKGFRGTCICYE